MFEHRDVVDHSRKYYTERKDDQSILYKLSTLQIIVISGVENIFCRLNKRVVVMYDTHTCIWNYY